MIHDRDVVCYRVRYGVFQDIGVLQGEDVAWLRVCHSQS